MSTSAPVRTTVLEVRSVHAHYGLSHVLQGVTLDIAEGEVVALLGRNGAGKTTTLRTVMQLIKPSNGQVVFRGRDVTNWAPYRIARLGLAYVPSGRRIYSSLTVRQNLLVGARAARAPSKQERWTIDRVRELFPQLAAIESRRAGLLSGGEQQMLKLGRALMTNPSLLLLDEPAEGLAPIVVGQLGAWLAMLRGTGLSILLSEQNMAFALKLANRGYILQKGAIRYTAASDELLSSPEVQQYMSL